MASASNFLYGGKKSASWKAMVVKIFDASLQSASDRAQKKLAPSPNRTLGPLSHHFATVYAMVVFPVPARPLSQNILCLDWRSITSGAVSMAVRSDP